MSFRLRSRGFTLLEVMIAFSIFALAVAAIFEVFAGATRRSGRAQETELLWLAAQSALEELRVREQPWPSHQEGKNASGESWTISVDPYDAGSDPRSPLHAYLVNVRVQSAATNRSVSLQSVEIGSGVP